MKKRYTWGDSFLWALFFYAFMILFGPMVLFKVNGVLSDKLGTSIYFLNSVPKYNGFFIWG